MVTRRGVVGEESPLRLIIFSSHFSRTAITDLHHNRCEDSPTMLHREVRPSPEMDVFPASNFHRSFSTYGTSQHTRNRTPIIKICS
jgi:hypothetical protein